jgi:hypothetical protein
MEKFGSEIRDTGKHPGSAKLLNPMVSDPYPIFEICGSTNVNTKNRIRIHSYLYMKVIQIHDIDLFMSPYICNISWIPLIPTAPVRSCV